MVPAPKLCIPTQGAILSLHTWRWLRMPAWCHSEKSVHLLHPPFAPLHSEGWILVPFFFFFNFIFHRQIRILGNWQIVFVYVFVPLWCSEVGGLFKIGILPWSCQFQDQDWHLAVKKTKPYLEKDVAHPHSLATQDWPQGMENLHPGCLGWVESLACILKGEIFRKVIEAKH